MDEQPTLVEIRPQRLVTDERTRTIFVYSTVACIIWLIDSLLFLYRQSSESYFVACSFGIAAWYSANMMIAKYRVAMDDLTRDTHVRAVNDTVWILFTFFQLPLTWQTLRMNQIIYNLFCIASNFIKAAVQ